MTTYQEPTAEEVTSYLRERRNWGRWGADDQRGAINLITPEKRVQAAGLVRSGRIVSLSRDVPVRPGPGNPMPAQHWVRTMPGPRGGGAVDYYGLVYHGYVTTHLDALCHVWDNDGMWNGRDPEKEVTSAGARFGGIEHWREGIVTRGVLLDVPKHRGEPSVTLEAPVHGEELEAIAKAQGVTLGPGDALVVYSGREAWQAAHPDWSGYAPPSPGLHASCLKFIRDHDVALLVWDLMDAVPNPYGLAWSVHAAIFAYGVGLVDNSLLQPLAEACAAEGRYEFMLSLAPLPFVGGTGSPVNPVALF
ncbi:MAG TPA: cyclase family protein [Dehalococcoidia bacterium]|nr:cyclase family protein [Dehalococcoidia bacterium]